MSNKIDPGLKRVIGFGVALIGGAILHHNVQKLDRQVKNYNKNEPWDLLWYQLSRYVVICPNPKCKHIVKCSALDAQLSEKWHCNKCGCVWMETSHHDIIIKEGK